MFSIASEFVLKLQLNSEVKKILHLTSQTANSMNHSIAASWRKSNEKVKLFLPVTCGEWDKDLIDIIGKWTFWILEQPLFFITAIIIHKTKFGVHFLNGGWIQCHIKMAYLWSYQNAVVTWYKSFWFKCDTEARVKAMLCVCSPAPSLFHGLQLSKFRAGCCWALVTGVGCWLMPDSYMLSKRCFSQKSDCAPWKLMEVDCSHGLQL